MQKQLERLMGKRACTKPDPRVHWIAPLDEKERAGLRPGQRIVTRTNTRDAIRGLGDGYRAHQR